MYIMNGSIMKQLWLIIFSTLLCLNIPISAEAKIITAIAPKQEDNGGVCPKAALSRLMRHKIAGGENLQSIANKYNLNTATLMGLNPSLRSGIAPVGAEILIPPINGIRVEVPKGQTWREVATAYKVRPDVLFEVNGCVPVPTVVFIPGVNWSNKMPGNQAPIPIVPDNNILATYPLPKEGKIILNFGWKVQPQTDKTFFHTGLDIQAELGTPVLSVGAGTIAFAGDRNSSGNLVVINHAGGKQTRYAHLGNITVKTGQKVDRGTQIGTVGITGNPDVNEPHLHFEIRYNSVQGWVAEDPEIYLQQMQLAGK